MRRLPYFVRLLAGVVALTILAAACGGGDDDGSSPAAGGGEGDLTGSITISGSSTVEPISSLVAELFNDDNPDVSITVDGPGTGDGFELFCKGETDISDASRPIEPEEAQACKKAGIDYTELEIGLDGITVMTNPANGDVPCLNKGDLYALFGPESDGFSTWADADLLAKQVGGNGGFPDSPLEITAPGEESGTYDAFIELAGIEDTALKQGVPEDEAAALRSDYTSSANDNVIIQAMEGSDGALGFVGFSFADSAGDQVKKIQVDGGDGCVDPSFDTISDGSYPLSRSLYIYVNNAKASTGENSAAITAYVDTYVSSTGLQEAVDGADYVTLPDQRQQATADAWSTAGS
jgi:phosphate transport system substrate-binding protein